MANLGDKQINHNYYGFGSRIWTKDGVDVATLTEKNLFRYYYTGTPPASIVSNFGKPFNDSICLWKVNKKSSFATYAYFARLDGNDSEFLTGYSEKTEDPGMLMYAKNCDNNSSDIDLSSNPSYRYAYDTTVFTGVGYSSLISDINYAGYCLYCRINVYNKSTNAIGGQDLNTLAAYINGDSDNRRVTFLRSDMYYGSSSSRSTTQAFIPVEPGESMAYRCVPLAECYSDRNIPDIESVRKYIQTDTHNTVHDNWTSDKVFSPFQYQYRNVTWFATSSYVNDLSNFYNIGFNRGRTKNQWISGAYGVPNSTDKITGEFFRLNTSQQYFDDVTYHWRTVIYDSTLNIELSPDSDLSLITSNDNIRIMSELVIDDTKGDNIGNATVKAVKHELAYIGFYFADTATLAADADFINGNLTGIYCPVFENGVTTGLYKTGNDIKTLPNWNSSSVADEVFKNIPGASDSDSGDLTTHTHSGYVAGGAHWYGMTTTELGQLSTWLNTTYQPTDETEFIQDFKGVNPADYLVSIKYYPFAVPTTNLTVSFVIGGLTVPCLSPEVLLRDYGKGSSSWYDLGSITLQQPLVYGDFRDKYIKMLLYVPWCGMATIDPAVFCPSPDGTIHALSVALSVDFATGSCTGYIYRDYTLMDSIQGSCGIDIPMSAVNNGSYQNQIKQTEIALKQAENTRTAALVGAIGASIATGAAIVTGNPLAVAAAAGGVLSAGTKYENAALQVEGLQYQLEHTAPAVGNVSAASPFNNMIDEQAARIFIFKPVMLQNADVAAYGHTVGYACCKAGKLSSFSGFTVCSDADLSGIKAPSGHKTAIMQLLQGGVYL